MSFVSNIKRLASFGLQKTKMQRNHTSYVGCVTAVDAHTVRGWAIDGERPDQSLEIELRLGDNYFVTVKADEFPADLQHYGRGRHAFTFRYPPEAGVADLLTARIKNTDFVLTGSPVPLKQKYIGSVWAVDAYTALGWVMENERPDQSLEIELRLGDNYFVTVKADECLAGLQGPHGFTFRYPPEAGVADLLTARIKNTDFVLNPVKRKQEFISVISGDIVNQCNLRCPFCVVDYTNFGKLELMTRETFDRYLELLPVTAPGGFWLSCLNEPTMHPQFIDFIEAAPEAYRDRISFTTNLTRRLSTDMLERLANSGVAQIRVSFDSRRPEVFAELRKKGKYEVFENNLRRLSAALKTSGRRPHLHFITMALKDNYREIADLVHFGRELGADSHEIRDAYYSPHIAHWGKEHFLNAVEWAELNRLLEPVASPMLSVYRPSQDVLAHCEAELGLAEYVAPEDTFGGNIDHSALVTPEPAMVGQRLPDEALSLWLRWDGLMNSQRLSADEFCVNINKLEHPAEYFRALRLSASAAAAERATQTAIDYYVPAPPTALNANTPLLAFASDTHPSTELSPRASEDLERSAAREKQCLVSEIS